MVEPISVKTVYEKSRARNTPAGMEMKERATGVMRPSKTARLPKRSNQRSAR